MISGIIYEHDIINKYLLLLLYIIMQNTSHVVPINNQTSITLFCHDNNVA